MAKTVSQERKKKAHSCTKPTNAWGAKRTSSLTNALGDSGTRQQIACTAAAKQHLKVDIPAAQWLKWVGTSGKTPLHKRAGIEKVVARAQERGEQTLKMIAQVKTNELHPAGAREEARMLLSDGKWPYGKLASSRLHATWHGEARAELIRWALKWHKEPQDQTIEGCSG